jgi:hypothetical protein
MRPGVRRRNQFAPEQVIVLIDGLLLPNKGYQELIVKSNEDYESVLVSPGLDPADVPPRRYIHRPRG